MTKMLQNTNVMFNFVNKRTHDLSAARLSQENGFKPINPFIQSNLYVINSERFTKYSTFIMT
jgi:hypothetical protein